jgi:SSS family solute:Na+ symporter
MYSRIFCARDGKTARKAVLWAALLIVPFALAVTVIGMGASALFPGITADQAIPQVITEMLPPALAGIVLAALLCAFMSSADTTLMSASTILTVDIIGYFKPNLSQKQSLLISRLGIVLLGGSLVLALYMNSINQRHLFAYTVYTRISAVIAVSTRISEVNATGALIALIGGGGGAVSKIWA